MTSRTARRTVVEKLELIDQIIHSLSARGQLPAGQREDFRSLVLLRMVENDYAVLRRYQGRSRLRTYLHTVIYRLLLDYRNSTLGKWRPSAEAKRLGSLGVEVDRLINRDGYRKSDARNEIRQRYPELTSTQIERVTTRVRRRLRRVLVDTEELAPLPAQPEPFEDHLERDHRRRSRRRIQEALRDAFRMLEDQERSLLRHRFGENLTVAEIARRLDLDPKATYRRFKKISARLRRFLEERGVTYDQVKQLTGRPSNEIIVRY